ncbi:family 12 glycosyl hydrolase [Xylariomycetidae sp. FL2044]|nr:family 12 glycosyl hydrolase [Xylariomycetidae sp. FL2044]
MKTAAVFSSLAATSAGLFGLTRATPTPPTSTTGTVVDKRATTFCGQWDSIETSGYTVYNNLWGQDNGSGSQCTTVEDSSSSSSLAWSTSWSWSGGEYNVKSYANAVVAFTAKQLSALASIPSTWAWSYAGSDIVANVAYDLFTASTTDGSPEYEIMIWLAALGGAGPISSTGSPIATPTVNGVTWDLYYGPNGQMEVYSFVASSQQTSFSADLVDFISYLTTSQGLPTSQYLQSVGAGTEPFVGSDAVLTTSAYSAVVN